MEKAKDIQNILDYITINIELEKDLSLIFPEDKVYNNARIMAFKEIKDYIEKYIK